MRLNYVLPIADEAAVLELVGGKGASLARMAGSGLPIPDGFHITTAAYWKFVETNQLQAAIYVALDKLDHDDPFSFELTSTNIARLFNEATIPDEVSNEIRLAYASFSSVDLPVAVRSSATAEDLPEASFAGQQDTYLNVCGEKAVLEVVKKCWASLWTARAISYRLKNGIDQNTVALAVVVQELIVADSAGIMFTVNPVNGKRNEVVINSAWGLGEAVVSGAVTPDTIIVDKVKEKVIHREIAEKRVMTTRVKTGTTDLPVPAELRRKLSLIDSRAIELTILGKKIEELFGLPVDIEWVFSKGKLSIVQARPITSITPEWALPNPKAMYARGSLAEHLPNPVTPLFGSLGLRTINKATAELSTMMKIDLVEMEYQYRPINGYVFMGVRLTPRFIWAMVKASILNTKMMLTQGIQRWQVARQELFDVLKHYEQLNVTSLSSGELLAGVDEIYTQLGRLYTVLQSGTLPSASSSEIVFSRIYKLVKRREDPDSSIFLFGFDTVPMLAEKSLYDLAMWIKERPGLVDTIQNLPPVNLVSLIKTGIVPEALPENDWCEFTQRLDAYLEEFGSTVYELDFANPTPGESPGPVLDALRMYLNGKGANPYIRQKVAVENREKASQKVLARIGWPIKNWFKKSLKWAQECGPAREDSLIDLGKANPQVRKMLCEVGRRLKDNGAIENAQEIFWLDERELIELVNMLDHQKPLPDMTSLVIDRKNLWQSQLSLLPPAILPEKASFGKLIPWHKTDQKGNVLRGFGASKGVVTAPACILLSPDDFRKMKPGMVMVAVTTTPAWTPLFTMASAVVTDIGGPLSHSSIVAREYSIPAVMAVGLATRRITDGQMITVDGGAGTVTLLK